MDLRVYLKICEGCGCLWYRAQVETRVYCAACNERFKQFPTPQSRKRRGRPRKMILPTVFAVQASAEMIFQERLATANSTSYVERTGFRGLAPVQGSNGHCFNENCSNGPMPVALRASDAATLSTRTTGGAQ